MSERSKAVEQQSVRDASAVYSVKPEIGTAEDVPPGYKRTEVGVIPEDWGIGCLGDFYEIKSSKRVLQRDWRLYGVPFYRTREVAVLAEKGHVDNELHISEELYSDYSKKYGVPKPGDVLVTGIGTIGKMYVVPDDRKFYFKDASIIWLKSRQSFDSAYLKQLFETHIIRSQLSDASTGTTVDTYTISGANKTAVPVPHITEQRAIATALSDADALIESLDRLIAKKRAIKQATMQQLLTGQTRLPGFTGKWEFTAFSNVVRHHSGNSALIKGKLSLSPGSGLYPGFSASGQDIWCSGYEYEGNAVVVSAVGSRCGKAFVASGRWNAIANTHVVWPVTSKVDWRFLSLFLNREDFWLKSGSGPLVSQRFCGVAHKYLIR